jgi:flagellar hook assembly protein FlgD
MKQRLLITLVTIVLLLVGAGSISYAGTYASGLRVTNPDTVSAFDGSFQDGTGALLWFTLNAPADTVKVRVKMGANVVRTFAPRINDTAGTFNIAWDGKDDLNNVVLTGRYTLEVFTSDTGNSSASWAKVWESKVRPEGSGLSNRDIEVVNDPASPWFGNLIISESGVGHARLLVANAVGKYLTEFGSEYFPAVPTGVDPWYMTTSQIGDLYVSSQTNDASGGKIFVFRNGILTQTIRDTIAFQFPRGIAVYGAGATPTLLVANANRLLRRSPAGVVDTLFVGGAYVRDVAVDDSGYVYVSFGGSTTTYTNVARGKITGSAFAILDTLVLPARVTHLYVYRGTNFTSNADDMILARVRDASGGIFKLDYAAKTSTKLFLPSGITGGSDYHAMATDYLGNIYYANPSQEWVQMYVPPQSAPAKQTTARDFSVTTIETKIIDDFTKHAGHFGNPPNSTTAISPTYSGSTVGIAATSAAKWVTDRNRSAGPAGAIEITMEDNPAVTTDWQVRYLSGIGAPASNDSLAPFGYIGFWVRTSNAPPGATVAIGIDDPADGPTKRSVPLPAINDGDWHLYQWKLDDETQWTPWVVNSGKSRIVGPRVNIDAVWFLAPNNPGSWTVHLDDVSYNPFGMIEVDAGRGDITGNGTISVLDASWILQSVATTRTLTAIQKKIGDVNLSSQGTEVDALDASIVLAHVVGKIPFLPWKQALPPLTNVNSNEPAPVTVIIASVRSDAGKIITIPVSIPSDLAGLRSAQMKVNFNASLLEVLEVTTAEMTKEFALESKIENGSVTIAMANAEALPYGGQILTIKARVKSSDNIDFTIDRIQLNDQVINKVTSVGGKLAEVPETYELRQNYPNPFNPTTTIEYQLPQAGFVELKIYDVTGREITTLVSSLQDAGTYRMTWNGTDTYGSKVASGMYLYRIKAGTFTQIKKMMLLK